MTQAIRVYGPAFSNFVRSVLLVCEEKGLAWTLDKTLGTDPRNLNTPEFLALNPYGKIPVIEHNGVRLFETAAILRYLDTLGDGAALQPQDAAARAHCDQWCQAISIYTDRALIRKVLLEFSIPRGPDGSVREDHVAAALPYAQKQLAIISQTLGNQRWICGDLFTLADCLLGPMLDYMVKVAPLRALVNDTETLADYTRRLQARPSAQRILSLR